MQKLTLSVLASALLAANVANAVEVYKNDTSDVNLYGRVYAGHQFSSDEGEEGSDSYIRLGAKLKTQINDSLYGKGRIEYNVDNFTNNEKSSRMRVRQAWAGLGGDWGMLSYGRQYGAATLVADYTDVLYHFGNDAIGTGSDTFGTGRSSDLLKYAGQFDGLALAASYQFNNEESTENEESASSYGLAAEYALDMGLAFSAGYTMGERAANGEDAKLTLVGVKYDANDLYVALTYSDGSDWDAQGEDWEGIEAALAYSLGNGAELLAGYNNAESDNTDAADYYTLGAQYKFNKNLRTFIEHKFDNMDDADDITAVVVRYDF